MGWIEDYASKQRTPAGGVARSSFTINGDNQLPEQTLDSTGKAIEGPARCGIGNDGRFSQFQADIYGETHGRILLV